MDPYLLRYGTVALQAATFLKLAFLLVSFLSSGSLRSFFPRALAMWMSKCRKQIQSWWKGRRRDSPELDEMRCLWARRVMNIIFVSVMGRLILYQASASYP